jgi:uncharacterized protein with beta-barrel porin domain
MGTNDSKIFLRACTVISIFSINFAVSAADQTVTAGAVLGPPAFITENSVSLGAPVPQAAAGFWGPATDATLIVGSGQNLGLGVLGSGYSVRSVTSGGAFNLGFVNFEGNSTAAGTMGVILSPLHSIRGGAAGTTVVFNGAIRSQTIEFTAVSTMLFNANTQANLNYGNFNGTAVIGPGVSFTGAATSVIADTGILTLNNTAHYIGDIGTAISCINQINLNGNATITGATASQNIILGLNTLTQGGAVYFPNNAVIQSNVIDDIHYGAIDATGFPITFASGLKVNVQIDNNATFSGAPLQLVRGNSAALISAPITATSDKARIAFSGMNSAGTGNAVLFPTIVPATLPTNSVAKGAALAFDAGFFGASGDFLSVQKSVTLLNDLNAIGAAEAQLAPIVNGANTFMSFQAANQSQNLWSANLSNARAAGYASGLLEVQDRFQNDAAGLWVEGFKYSANQGTHKKMPGYQANMQGGMVALQGSIAKHWQLGIGSGYAHTTINGKEQQKNGSKIGSPNATLYLGYHSNSWYWHNFFTLALNRYRDFRHIQFANINRVASAKYHGQQSSALLSAGRDYLLDSGFTVTPSASLQLARLRTSGYTETGASSLNLVQKSQHRNLIQTGLGLKLGYPIQLRFNTLYTEIHSKWFYNLSNKRVRHTSRFVGGGPSFNTVGAKPFPNQINVGLSSTLLAAGHLSLKACYDVNLQHHFQSFQGNILISYNF